MDHYKLSLGISYYPHFFLTKLICCIFPDNNITRMRSFLKADRASLEKLCSATLNMGWLIKPECRLKFYWCYQKKEKKRRNKLSYGKDSNSLAKAIFTFYQTALEATRQTYWIGLLFKHTTKKSHSDFGAISVPKRCCASAIFEM